MDNTNFLGYLVVLSKNSRTARPLKVSCLLLCRDKGLNENCNFHTVCIISMICPILLFQSPFVQLRIEQINDLNEHYENFSLSIIHSIAFAITFKNLKRSIYKVAVYYSVKQTISHKNSEVIACILTSTIILDKSI